METSAKIGVAMTMAGLLGGSCLGQSVEVRVLLRHEDAVIPSGIPALHDGVYTAFGSERGSGRSVIYAGRLDQPVSTAPTIIAGSGDPVPNRDGAGFRFMRFPTVWQGSVYFPGGGQSRPTPSDGLYARSFEGGPMGVLSDRLNGLGPWIELPFAGAEGIAWVYPAVDAGTGVGIGIYGYDGSWRRVVDYLTPLPGGGLFSSTVYSHVAIGGGKVAFSGLATNLSSAAGQGVYCYDIASGQTSLIANWTTPIPGDGRLMEAANFVDTDGRSVVFRAQAGFVGFGGVAALCQADADGGNVRALLRTGQAMPGTPGAVVDNIDQVAVDRGIVYGTITYFEGNTRRYGVYAYAGGSWLPVLAGGASIDGIDEVIAFLDPRGVDGHDLVLAVTYPNPAGSVFGPRYALAHARISVCAADLDDGTLTGRPDGGVTIDDLVYFLDRFGAGDPAADVDDGTSTGTPDGGVTIDDLVYFLARFDLGC